MGARDERLLATGLQKLGETQDLRFSWRANLDEAWSIEVRPFGTLNRPGTLASAYYAVSGLSVAPDAPTNVTSTPTHLFFTPSAALDIAGYQKLLKPEARVLIDVKGVVDKAAAQAAGLRFWRL